MTSFCKRGRLRTVYMTPERWQQVEDLLQAALDRPPSERASFLSEACSGDEELAGETSSLIDAYGEAGDFLEEPAIARDAQAIVGEVGQEIGPYEVMNRLGGGGMGDVYLVRDPRLDRLVALKVLPAYYVSDDERLRRFQIEARAASALNHANILTIYEVGQAEDTFFIATEYIDGTTIRERIRAGDLSLGEVLEIVEQLLAGLTAAHTAGIVHRDIKPENVMQRGDGAIKILDFGIAKLLERSPGKSATSTLTETEFGVTLGTLGYMSPEQVRGLPVDERTDIWSCGVVLYEMLSGRRPFNGTSNADTIVAMLEREPAPLFGTSGHEALRQIQAVVWKALKKDPKERYQSAADMRADLDRLRFEIRKSKSIQAINEATNIGDLPALASRAATPQFRRELLILIGAAVLVAVFAAVYLYQHYVARPSPAP